MTALTAPDLYWTGGPFRVSLQHPNHIPQKHVDKAITTLEAFRSDCQSHYCAFSGAINGRTLAYERFKPMMQSRTNMFSVGTGFPDSEQRPGKSTIAQMRQGDLLDGLKPGGMFEDRHAKAFIVMIYHRWDEFFRDVIAESLSVEKSKVECDLMGDVRHVRNAIIHHNSEIKQETLGKLELLPRIWNLSVGALSLSEGMLHSLMEQINAIYVRIADVSEEPPAPGTLRR
ncbi:MAG: hypothetical protein F4X13_14855 [Gammaproteobacteria bacterium]|nr:hypothetical protein [Gammaproteobacteria bacterium]